MYNKPVMEEKIFEVNAACACLCGFSSGSGSGGGNDVAVVGP